MTDNHAKLMDSIVEEAEPEFADLAYQLPTKHHAQISSNEQIYASNETLLHRVGMHNSRTPQGVGVSKDEVQRPPNKKLGQYFRAGFRPFVDKEKRQYFMFNPATSEVIIYNPRLREFEPASLGDLTHHD